MVEVTAEMVVDGLLPGDPRVSPDGCYVAFTVAPRGKREEHPQGAIWLVPTDGSVAPRRVTAGEAEDRAPRWSPDGRWLYFLSDRAERGKAQLHRLRLDGGEAEALTDWKPGIADFVPLPDGRAVALRAEDAPTEEDDRRERERDDTDVFGGRWKRHRLRLLDVESREIRAILGQDGELAERHVAEVAPSPDGARLAIVSWPTPELDNGSREATLQLVEPASGRVETVCAMPTGGGEVAWDAAGERLSYLAGARPGGVSGRIVFAVDLGEGQARPLRDDLEACPVGLAPGGDGAIYVTVATGLDTTVERLDPATGALSRLAHYPGGLSGLTASADGQTVAALRGTADGPAEVWAGPPEGPLKRLTDVQAPLRAVAWGRQERLAWTAPDGLALDGLLILPPGRGREDGPFPLIVVAHGGPYGRFADEFQLAWAPSGQWLATAGYAVFLPNPRGGMGHGVRFAAAAAGAVGMEDWGDIVAGLDLLIEQGVADPDRLGIGGWSQGGFMTAWAVGQDPETDAPRFKAGVMGAGVSDWGMMVAESDLPHFEGQLGGSTGWEGVGPHRHDALSPISFIHRVNTPVLILHGERDERVPVSQGRFFARGLRERGVPFELVVYPREPHGLRERHHQLDALRRARAWFDRWLRGDEETEGRGRKAEGGQARETPSPPPPAGGDPSPHAGRGVGELPTAAPEP